MGEAKQSRGLDFWLPIGIAAVALVGVAIMVAVSWPTADRAPGADSGGGSAPPPPPAAFQDPRTVADQLYNRAMMAHESGQPQAGAFLAEAAVAYERLEPLDADGLFHLATLQLAGGDDGGARVSANRILINAPDHLLGLSAAAQASEKSAPEVARRLWQHYLDVYDAQQGRELEYAHHERLFPVINERARAFIASSPGAAARP